MGADRYETDLEKKRNADRGIPNIGIGGGSIIRKAIIDKNARIGFNCRIGIDPIPRGEGEYPTHYVVDGVIVIPKNTILPAGTSI
jgi:glucose-1-phosphate adenylyltransferase